MSTTVQAVEQSTGTVKQIPLGGSLAVKPGDVFKLSLDRADVAAVERVGRDLVLTLTDGSKLTFEGYYDSDGAGKHAEVALQDDDGGLWWLRGEETGAFTYTEIASLDEVGGATLVAAGGAEAGAVAAAGGLSTGAAVGLGALALAGLAAAAGGGGGGGGSPSSPNSGTTPVDTTPPSAPTATVSDDGDTVTGHAEPGSTVKVTGPDGSTLGTGTAGSDGSYSVTIPAQTNGEDLNVTATDSSGNTSAPTQATAPDTTAPAAPTAAINDAGDTITGHAEVGSTVTVIGPDGSVLGTATAGGDGSYSVSIPAQTNAQELQVTATDAAGNASAQTEVTAPDTTAPAAPTADFSSDGSSISGTAEPGSTVTITDDGGHVLGTATAGSDGAYTVTLSSPLTNGQEVSATATDAAGNTSPATEATAPDTTAPAVPTATINDAGDTVTGHAEPGSTVTVTGPDGSPLGTGTAGSDGSYSVTIPAQTNGENLDVTATDATGNESDPIEVTAPDTTAPAAPTAEFSTDGGSISGIAEPGSTVTITDDGGHVLGTATADSDGAYTVTLSEPQTDHETVGVTATDAAGNVSDPTDAVAPDLTAPAAPTASIDAEGTVVSGTAEAGSTVNVYAADGTTVLGTSTVDANGNYSVTLSDPQTDGEHLTVTATDASDNTSAPADVVAPDLLLAAIDDVYTLQEGNYAETVHAPETAQGVQVLGLLDSDGGANVDNTVTVADGWAGELTVTISQQSLLAVAGAYQVDVYDSAGNLVYVATSTGAPLAGDTGLLGTGVLGVSTDGSGLTFTVDGLPPGDYHVVVRDGGESNLQDLLDSNGDDTVSLAELGDAGVVLGPDNQAAVLAEVHAILANEYDDNLANAVTTLLGNTLDLTTVIGAGQLVDAVTDIPGITELFGGVVDPLLGALSTALLHNTLTLLQTTDLTTQLTEYQYDVTELSGNVVTDAEGADDVDAGAAVTSVAFGDTSVALVDGVATIAGDYGTLTIHADGSYTYDSNGTHAAIGQSEVFTYTLSDGTLSDTATLTINIADDLSTTTPTAAFAEDGGSISGTGHPGDTITVYGADADNDGNPDVLGTATVDGDGNYSVELATALVDGEAVTVTAQDEWGNQASANATAPDQTPLVANDDSAAVDMGGQQLESVSHDSASNVVVLSVAGLAPAQDDGLHFTVADGLVGNVVINVTQTALASVANAYVLEVYDSSGNVVYQATTNPALVGDVAGLDVLEVTGDDTLTATINGLPPGDYDVVVRNDSSTLNELVQALTLQDLGEDGVVLGADNQDAVLDAVQTALNGGVLGGVALPVGLGDVVRGVLETALDATTTLGVGDIVQAVTDIPLVNTLTGGVDVVLDAISAALLSNTLTALQYTDISIDQTNYGFLGEREVDGNVMTDAGGADAYVDPAAAVVSIGNSAGDTVAVAAGTPATIAGDYGTLTIHADGSYSYEAYGSRESVGQTDVFTYTLSGSGSTDTATLSIAIAGQLVDAHDDYATANISLMHPVTTDAPVDGFIDQTVVLGLLGIPVHVTSDTFQVAENTTKDVVFSVDTDAVVSVASGFTLELQQQQADGSWQTVDNGSSGGVLDLLGLVDNQGQFEFDDLEAGAYRLYATYQALASVAPHLEVDMASSTTDLSQYAVGGIVEADGNLLEGDPGIVTDNDITGTGATTLAVRVDGEYQDVPADGSITVTGQYGTLHVFADGDYRYEPDSVAANIGKSESFAYRITDAEGHTDTATLTVDIEDPDASASVQSLMAESATQSLLVDDGSGGTLDLGSSGIEPAAAAASIHVLPAAADSEDELLHHALA